MGEVPQEVCHWCESPLRTRPPTKMFQCGSYWQSQDPAQRTRTDACKIIANLKTILRGLCEHESDPCSLDHEGYCQGHGRFDEPEEGGCMIRQARTALGLDL